MTACVRDALPADPAELRAPVVELSALIQAKDAQIRRLEAQVATLTARGQRKDSSTSSKPPSSDSIFTKQPRRSDRSLRERGPQMYGRAIFDLLRKRVLLAT